MSRTKKGADSDPFAVAELQTARATVAWHFGDQQEALRATGATTRLLDKHAPQSPNALMAQMRLLQAQYQLDGLRYNIGRLKSLSERATDANQPLIAMRADLGRAAMLYRTIRRDESTRLLDTIQASDVPRAGALRTAAQILAMRLVASDRDTQAVEALIARLTEEQKGQGPILVWSPPMPTPYEPRDVPLDRNAILSEAGSEYMALQWVDIGFAIEPDGRVESAEVLRGSQGNGWAKPLVEAISQRRYTPSAELEDIAGRYRIERFTLTASFVVPRNSLVRRRTGIKQFEQMDLTLAPPSVSQSQPRPRAPTGV